MIHLLQSHCPMPSCLYFPFTKTVRVQAQGRPLCHWQQWPPRSPLAQGQLFTARELHLCPSWISPTTSRQKKMSLLPWWCQVMDFMFASGVQVKTWGSHWRWPSQLRHLYRSCVQTYRLPWGSIKGGSGAMLSMSDLFVCWGLLLCML